MLEEFGVPNETEGVLGIQVFNALRGYAEPSTFEIPSEELDGVRLRLGVLPDQYLDLRALGAAQVEHLLSGLNRAVPFHERVEAALERERTEFRFASRPMAALIGWRATSISRREPIAEWDWADMEAEYARVTGLREEVHAALDRQAAVLSVGLPELIEDRAATHTFVVAPAQRPMVVIRGEVGTPGIYTTEHGEPPRAEIDNWIERVSRVPAALFDAIEEPLGLLAAARALEPSWRRFTLGWAVLERLAGNVGSLLDDQIVVEQRHRPSCGADLTDRKPGARQRLEELIRVLHLREADDLVDELNRVNKVRGRSHGGHIANGLDLLAPERLASAILRGIVADPGRVAHLIQDESTADHGGKPQASSETG